MEFVPSLFNVFKILQNDFADHPFFLWIEIVGIGLMDVKILAIKPELAFHIPLGTVDMSRFTTFIGEEMEAPSEISRIVGMM